MAENLDGSTRIVETPAPDDKKAWEKPEIEILSLEELVDLAEVKIAFATTTQGSDIRP